MNTVSTARKYVLEIADRLNLLLKEAIRNEVFDILQKIWPTNLTTAPATKTAEKRSNVRRCIAKGCRKLSKGPRFHFLCENHMGASKAQVHAWKTGEPMPKAKPRTKPTKVTAKAKNGVSKKPTPKTEPKQPNANA